MRGWGGRGCFMLFYAISHRFALYAQTLNNIKSQFHISGWGEKNYQINNCQDGQEWYKLVKFSLFSFKSRLLFGSYAVIARRRIQHSTETIGYLIDQCDLVELPPEHAELLLKFVPTKAEVSTAITCVSCIAVQTICLMKERWTIQVANTFFSICFFSYFKSIQKYNKVAFVDKKISIDIAHQKMQMKLFVAKDVDTCWWKKKLNLNAVLLFFL